MMELVFIAVRNLRKRKLRSFLTLLGIVIGVASIVAIVSSTQSMQRHVISKLSAFMSDVITILPTRATAVSLTRPFQSGKTIEFDDKLIEEIERIEGVEAITGIISTTAEVKYKDEIIRITVLGIQNPEAWRKIETESLGLEAGRFLTSNDKYAVLLGNSVADEMFSEKIGLRKILEINGKSFRVVGILKKAGGILSIVDERVAIPLKSFKEVFELEEVKYSMISLKVKEGYEVQEVADRINEFLLKKFKQTEDDKTFTLLTSKFFEEQVSSIMSILSIFMGTIASISLIVGGIGIMNIMYVSVTERTREIGILKAIGATNRTILLMFLIESALIGLIGGVIGDVFGILMGYGVNSFSNYLRGRAIAQTMGESSTEFQLPFIFSPEILGIGLIFGFLVGLVAGYLPARKAAKLEPVQALRYE